MTPPKDRQRLWLSVWQLFGIRLPHKALTPGHSTPLDFLFDALTHPGSDMAAWANRRGCKTLSASLLAAMEYRIGAGPIRSKILSGSEDQARGLYEYWLSWCQAALGDLLIGEPGRQMTRLVNGDLEILSASQRRVRGPAVQRMYWDEVDEIDPAVLSASVGSLNSLAGVPARSVATSTWHNADGAMGRLVAEAEAKAIRLHRWNIWETLERCPTERHDRGRNCERCRLGEVCLAQARRMHPAASIGAAAESAGLLAVDDAIRQFSLWSRRQWDAEAECLRPRLDGLVYSEFDRRDHVADRLACSANLPLYRAIDWGLNEFVCLWVQVDKCGRVAVVDELVLNQATVHQAACEILRRDADRPVEATYCDPAGRNRNDQTGYSDIEVFARRGIECRYRLDGWSREVRNGINLVRGALKPAVGPPRLSIAGRCTRLIRAMESYRLRQVNGQWLDEPLKPQPDDHAVDALRYFFVNRCAAANTGVQRLPLA